MNDPYEHYPQHRPVQHPGSGDPDNLVLCQNCGQYETTSPRRVCWRCLEQDAIDNAEPPGPIDWSAWDAEYLEVDPLQVSPDLVSGTIHFKNRDGSIFTVENIGKPAAGVNEHWPLKPAGGQDDK